MENSVSSMKQTIIFGCLKTVLPEFLTQYKSLLAKERSRHGGGVRPTEDLLDPSVTGEKLIIEWRPPSPRTVPLFLHSSVIFVSRSSVESPNQFLTFFRIEEKTMVSFRPLPKLRMFNSTNLKKTYKQLRRNCTIWNRD